MSPLDDNPVRGRIATARAAEAAGEKPFMGPWQVG